MERINEAIRKVSERTGQSTDDIWAIALKFYAQGETAEDIIAYFDWVINGPRMKSFTLKDAKCIDPDFIDRVFNKNVNYGNIKGDTSMSMDTKALKIVFDYANEHLDKSDSNVHFEVYIVWKVKALQNWKYLISTSLPDGMYYELTYNGDKKEWYLDAYKKFENRCYKEN